VLTFPVAFQCFQPIARRRSKVFPPGGRFDLIQFPARRGRDAGIPAVLACLEQLPRLFIPEVDDPLATL
jgi:hypothetical protein